MYDFVNVPSQYKDELTILVSRILASSIDPHDFEFVNIRDTILEEIDEAFDIDY